MREAVLLCDYELLKILRHRELRERIVHGFDGVVFSAPCARRRTGHKTRTIIFFSLRSLWLCGQMLLFLSPLVGVESS
jgi:hypothetical protein